MIVHVQYVIELCHKMKDDYLVSTFDMNEFQFEIKEDLFGLGYKRLDVANLFGQNSSAAASSLEKESLAASLLFPMVSNQNKSSKKAIKGHAFGVGDFEDDDDVDIYRQDAMESYDFELGGKMQVDARKALNKTYGFGAFENDVVILKLFSKSKRREEPAKYFAPPQVPPKFNLMHRLPDATTSAEEETPVLADNGRDSMSTYLKSISQRAEILGETGIKPESVFDLLNRESRELLKKQQELKQQMTKPAVEATVKERKDMRYQSFVSFVKKNFSDPYSFVDAKELTEWEKDREKDEFQSRYKTQMKIIEETVINKGNLRFTSTATLNEQNQEVERTIARDEKKMVVEQEEILSEMQQAAKDKKYGKLTRVEYEWRPNPVLCKRFNVPNPYPE